MEVKEHTLNTLEIQVAIEAWRTSIEKEKNVIKEANSKIEVLESLIYKLSKNPDFLTFNKTIDKVSEKFGDEIGRANEENESSPVARWANTKLHAEWSDDLTYPEKVLFAISKVQPCDTSKIAAKLVEYGVEPKKAQNEARYHTSRFNQAGRLEIVKKGRGKMGNIVMIK